MAPKLLPEYFSKSYSPRAIKKGHKWLNIAHRSIIKTPAIQLPYHKIRYLPKEWEYNPNVIWIFGDTVANVVWLKEPVAFVVQDKNVARAYRNYFDLLWATAEKK